MLRHELDEALLVVAFSYDVDKDVVLLEHAIDLVILVLDNSALSVPDHRLVHVLLLAYVLLICLSECCSQIV